MRSGLKYFLLELFVILVVSTPAMAIHIHSSGEHVAVATDGFDDGYYLVVLSDNSSKRVSGLLYWVVNNTHYTNLVLRSGTTADQLVAVSSKINNTEASENAYMIFGLSEGTPWIIMMNWMGKNLTDGVVELGKDADYIGGAYGSGHFVAIWEVNNVLYYAVFSEDGSQTDGPKELYPFGDPIHYSKIAYSSGVGRFGVFLVESNKTTHFLNFRITDGRVDDINVKTNIFDVAGIYEAAMAPSDEGFVIGYNTGKKWYTRGITVNPDGSIILGGEYGPFYRGYEACGAGSMDLVYNASSDVSSTKPYIIFVYDGKETADGNCEIVVQLLGLDGSPLNGNYDGDYVITDSSRNYINPVVAVKPFRSPAAYIISWEDASISSVVGSEYLSTDFSEVSTTNEVPFFSNAAFIGIVALVGILLFRRK